MQLFLHGTSKSNLAKLHHKNNNNKEGPLISAFVIGLRTCFTLVYIVQLFLTLADVIGENHELIFLNSIAGACSSADYS